MFESLVERDLRIYAQYLGGKLYHFRDNVSGLENNMKKKPKFMCNC